MKEPRLAQTLDKERSVQEMLPFQTILCPTDFSAFSFDALARAGELASHFQARLCIVHVVPSIEAFYALGAVPGSVPFVIADYEQAVREAARDKLREVAARPELKGVEVRTVLREGVATDEIVSAARDEGADLLVLPTHGLSGWRHVMFGSVAERVVRFAPCPVLVTHVARP